MATEIPTGYANPGALFVPGSKTFWNPTSQEVKEEVKEIPVDENGDPIHGEDC